MKNCFSLKKFTATAVLLSAGLIASGQAFAGMWVDNGGLIQDIDVRDGFLKIHLENSHSNTDSCTGGLGGDATRYIVINMANGEKEMLYSAVLSAFMGGREIGFGTDGCDTNWVAGGTFPKAYSIVIR